MKIIIDAMGGDNAPLEILKGAVMAKQEYGIDITAVGHTKKITDVAMQNNLDLSGINIVHAEDEISMCDDPTAAIRGKKDASLTVALRMLANGEGDALVSAGSTGAILAGATLIVKRLKGVKRPAITIAMPATKQPYVLIDSGANVECRPDMMCAFATMGSVYAKKVLGRTNPSVGLLNNGAEESKGTPDYVLAHQMLKQQQDINFIGNIEPKEVPKGEVDVVVCDGFAGNVLLKTTAGVAKMLSSEIKAVFSKNIVSKIAYLMVKSGMDAFKKKLDADELGGAIMLGVTKPVIKAQGSSNAKSFKNAIRQAKLCVEGDIIANMSEELNKNEK